TDAIAECEKVCKYIDIPLQHASDSLLSSMNRYDTRAKVEQLLANLRNKIPAICLRTTFIVGFPGETREQFNELKAFVAKEKFNCAGVFTYSQEEGTLAATMENQIPEAIKSERYHELMALQAEISEEIQQNREGEIFEVVIEAFDTENPGLAIGRSSWEAPDIDGKVFVENAGDFHIGDFIKVKILQGFTYEVVGEPVIKEEF
ncbi:MAG: radical SAM protein, partial [Acidaminococcaceae bacterium]|nr:radical SAM protein [Acidaminococcaceae bacterium]